MTLSRPHILIVEDELDLAECIRYNLERTSLFTSQIVENAEEAIDVIFQRSLPCQDQLCRVKERTVQNVALIIIDLNLPGINGLELCSRFRMEERTRLIPIIALTTHLEEAAKIKGLEAGADYYLTKPFSIRKLVACAHEALRQTKQENGFDLSDPNN